MTIERPEKVITPSLDALLDLSPNTCIIASILSISGKGAKLYALENFWWQKIAARPRFRVMRL